MSELLQEPKANSIMVRDADTVRTVETFRKRMKMKTRAGALSELVRRANAIGLHKKDISPSIIQAAMGRLPDEQHQ